MAAIPPRPVRPLLRWALAPLALVACVEDGAEVTPGPPPFQELEEVGLGEYFGTTNPTVEATTENETTWLFDQAEGAMCLRGGPFRVATRATESEDLVIFLQGGGACWSDFCFAIEDSYPGVPVLDVLNPDLEINPVRDWDVVYVPYCDGSLFAGDVDLDDTGDGVIDRYQRGRRNLSAAIDVAVAQFPNPRRILLAGSSGGGYGSILATILVRMRYPGVRIDVFNDSGTGIAKENDPAFLQNLVAEFNAGIFVPPSCEGCLDKGHLTPLIDWTLAHDPDLRISMFSSYGDNIIANLFLGVRQEGFAPPLIAETTALHEKYPDRFMPFLINGQTHTTLLGDVEGIIGVPSSGDSGLEEQFKIGSMEVSSGGTTIADWLTWMLEDDARWVPIVEPLAEE